MEVTKKLANFISETKVDKIPKEALEMAKKAILDCTGTILAGSVTETGSIIKNYIRSSEPKQTSTVLGTSLRASAENAALTNGVMGHALDFDDIHIHMLGHPTVVLLPAIYSLSEVVHSSGMEVLGGYVIGLEVAAKIGNAGITHHYRNGWHATGTLGTLGACAACSKLLKLNEEKTRMALGIAASMSSGIRANFGTMTKPFHAGNASKNGVMAAMIASKSFTAHKDILESEFGFFDTFFGKNHYDISKVTAYLGEPYEILSPGLIFKPYPCCGETHQGIDAALSLRYRNPIDVNNIKSIKCVLSEMVANMLLYHKPRTGLEGKFCQEYCVAVALIDGRVSIDHFSDEKVLDPNIKRLIEKTKVEFKEFAKEVGEHTFPAEVIITMNSGEKYHCRIDNPKGSPDNPMSLLELEEKYRECAKYILSDTQISQSMELIETLERASSLDRLMDVLS